MHNWISWITFFLCTLFAIIFKAVMAGGDDETHWLDSFRLYITNKPITITFRFLIAQFAYFAIWDNPALVGNLFGVVGIGTFDIPTRWWLAGLLGLASDKLADVVIVMATWGYNKFMNFFK